EKLQTAEEAKPCRVTAGDRWDEANRRSEYSDDDGNEDTGSLSASSEDDSCITALG
ncbi:unnamed protein product, partial [Symbiodinium microadriaticum]